MPAMKCKRAFTLIELLVVIAIIAILAAILFPVFTSAKKSGQASACLGNIKQLGMASVLYADDNDGCIVPAVSGEYYSNQSSGFKERRYWRMLLFRYVKSAGAYVCPAMAREAYAWGSLEQDVPATYGINQTVTSNDSDWQGHYIHRISQFSRSSRVIIITEVRNGVWTTGEHLMLAINLLGNPKAKPPVAPYAPRWHNDRVNIAFLDGHARTMYMYDTIGAAPTDWLWWDYRVLGRSADSVKQTQEFYRNQWPKDYPPFGG